jgi:hypothetical protein
MSTVVVPPQRRTARLAIDTLELAHFLDLPEGCTVVAVETTNDPVSVVLILRSDDFPEVPHDAQSPYAHRTVVLEEAGGRVIRRTADLQVYSTMVASQ